MFRSRSPVLFAATGLLAILVSPARADLSFITVTVVGETVEGWHNTLDAIDEFDLTDYGLVEDFSWGVTITYEGHAQTPVPTYKPMTIRVRMSSAVIELANAYKAGRNVVVSIVTFERDASDGTLVQRYTYQVPYGLITRLDVYTVQEQGEPTTYVDFDVRSPVWGIEDAVSGLSFQDGFIPSP